MKGVVPSKTFITYSQNRQKSMIGGGSDSWGPRWLRERGSQIPHLNGAAMQMCDFCSIRMGDTGPRLQWSVWVPVVGPLANILLSPILWISDTFYWKDNHFQLETMSVLFWFQLNTMIYSIKNNQTITDKFQCFTKDICLETCVIFVTIWLFLCTSTSKFLCIIKARKSTASIPICSPNA